MSEHTDETSLRALLVGVHSKLDTVLRIQQITTADRMLDRGAIQRNTRRIVSLERQVAILSGASPSHASWHPDPLEVLATEREAEAEADSVLLEANAPLGRRPRDLHVRRRCRHELRRRADPSPLTGGAAARRRFASVLRHHQRPGRRPPTVIGPLPF
jgi:hypothetical protein